MHDRLMRHYGKQPIFYISKTFYNIVLAGEFKETLRCGCRSTKANLS